MDEIVVISDGMSHKVDPLVHSFVGWLSKR